MQTIEERIEKLEKQNLANRLQTSLLTGELHIYKAEICRGRWGSPGGNDIGFLELLKAREILMDAPWPGELVDSAKDLDKKIEIYSGYLKEMDITYVSLWDTRMKDAFKKLESDLRAWIG